MQTGFTVRDANGNPQTLKLVEVRQESPTDDSFNSGEQFSLFFGGNANRPLRQDTYSFEHARLGCFSMFIVPVGCPDPSACRYEAAFNRLTPERLRREVLAMRQDTP